MALDLGSYFTALQQPGPNAPAIQNPYPKGYMTPDAVKAMYDYSQALLKNSEGAVPGTKGGWTVGVQHLVDALMGGQQAYQANQAQLAGAGFRGAQREQAYSNTGTPGTSDSNSNSAPTPASQAGAENISPEGSDPMSKVAAITKGQEGGKYDGVTTTINQKTGKPQNALGAYGVMDFNVGPWSKEVLGKELTPQEFLHNPVAQDAIYKAKMGQYIQQYGVEGAGRAWLGGPGGVSHPERADPLGTKVGDYGHTFASKAGPALAFNGAPEDASGQNAIVMALNGGKTAPGAAPKAVAGVAPGESQTPIVSPFALPQRPHYTPEQFRLLSEDPNYTPAERSLIQQQYLEQRQPLAVPYLGGTAIANPKNPNQQFFSPGVHWGTTQGPEGISVPTPQTILPPGYSGGAPAVQNIQTQGAPAAAAPAGGAAPPPPLAPSAPITTVPSPQGALPPAANSPALALGGPAGVSDAVNSPVAQAAAATPPSATPGAAETPNQAVEAAQASVKPPSIIPNEPPPPEALNPMGDKVAAALGTQPPAAPGTQVAEISPQIKEMADFGQQYAQQKELNKTDAAQYTKNLQQYTDLGIRGANALPGLEIANKMLQDPRYMSGLGADLWEGMGKLKALVGIDKAAAAPMEIFNKILSGNIVTDLKTMLGGLGQIRLAEINLITNSVANKYNTPAANAAVLQMMKREYERTSQVGKIAAAYSQGWQLNDQDQWVRRAGVPTSAGLQQQVLSYTQKHPLFSDDEIKNIEALFNMSPKTTNAAVPADKTRAELENAAHVGFASPAQAEETQTAGSPQKAQPATPATPAPSATPGIIKYDATGKRIQ